MSYAGDVVRVLLLPFKLITVPLNWLFKHRCKFEPNEEVCKGIFCPMGKEGRPGWDNNTRGNEWVYRKPLPTTRPAAPTSPPKRGGFGRYYSESVWEEVLVNGVPQLMKDGRLVINGNKGKQQIQLGHHGSISIQGGGTVSISVNNNGQESSIRVEGDGEVFLISQKRNSN